MVTMDPPPAVKNVYVGPRPFEIGETLYGRDHELADLAGLLVSERLVLLHAPSGAGKTSLIQAGLIAAMENDHFIIPRMHADSCPTGASGTIGRPIILRVNRPPQPADPAAANRYLLSVMVALQEMLEKPQQKTVHDLAAFSFEEFLAGIPGNPLLLIFDQFEEILTLDPTDEPAKRAFFRQVGKALHGSNRWALFAMREDFLPALEAYFSPLPRRLAAMYRLNFLRKTQAIAAVREPAKQAGVDFAVADELVDNLLKVKVQQLDGAVLIKDGLYVEPVLLQVVCRRLWDKRLRPEVIDKGDLGCIGIDAILQEYCTETIQAAVAASQVKERQIWTWFATHLIRDKVRHPVRQGTEWRHGLNAACLQVLDKAFLIRKESRGGFFWYELSHDRLIEPVLAGNAHFQEQLSSFQKQAALWDEQGRSHDLLVKDDVFDEGKQLWAKDSATMTAAETAFLEACQEHRRTSEERRNYQKKLRVVYIVLAVFVPVLACLILWHWLGVHHRKDLVQKLDDESQLQQAYFEALLNYQYTLSTRSLSSADGNNVRRKLVNDFQENLFPNLSKKFKPKPETLASLAESEKQYIPFAVGAVRALERRAYRQSDQETVNKIYDLLQEVKQKRAAELAQLQSNPSSDPEHKKFLVQLNGEIQTAIDQVKFKKLFVHAKIGVQFSPTMRFGIVTLEADGTQKKLTYSNTGTTNSTRLKINDQTLFFGEVRDGEWIEKEKPLGNAADGKPRLGYHSTWRPFQKKPVGKGVAEKLPVPLPVRITQMVEVVRSDTGQYDTCLVGYLLSNEGTEPLHALLSITIDTCINQNDGNSFAYPAPGDEAPKPREIVIKDPLEFKMPKLPIPRYIKALESEDGSGLVAYFSLRMSGWDLPLTRFNADTRIHWDSYANMDWDMELQPGQSRSVGFAYGLSELRSKPGTVTPP